MNKNALMEKNKIRIIFISDICIMRQLSTQLNLKNGVSASCKWFESLRNASCNTVEIVQTH